MFNLKIRNIDPRTEAVLKREAQKKSLIKKEAIGVETLARQILEDYAIAPSIKKLEDRYEAMLTKVIDIYNMQQADLKEIIERNTYLLELLNERIER